MNQALFKDFFPPEVEPFFVDRTMDFVLPPEAKGISSQQKSFLSEKFKLDTDKVFTIRQVHDKKILFIVRDDVPQRGPILEADGVVTNVPGIVLAVRTADCLPIFLFDPKKKCIGLVHAGWRGSSEKIIVAAIHMMREKYGAHATDLLVALGPAIRSCCYEVGEEFKDVFPHEVAQHKGKLHLDMALVNKHQLMAQGVKAAHIFDSQKCTVCDTNFFSYRRDKEKSGRHLSLFVLKEF